MAPSNKIIYVFLSTVIIIIVVIVGHHLFKSISVKNSEVAKQPQTILTIKRNPSEEQKDKDKDGLADWEELLHHTDENNSDTDGDGTLDGEEVAENRDPIKAGPNDKVGTYYDNEMFYAGFQENTLTDKLSVNLASNLVSFTQAGAYTPEIRDGLVTSLVSDVQKITAYQNIYTENNLKIISSPTKEQITAYATQFATQQLAFLRKTALIKNTNHSIYISQVAESYKEFSRYLVQLPVPSSVAQSHLQISNNFYNIGITLDELNLADSEPTTALMAVGKFQEIEDMQPTLYEEIGTFIRNNDIIFTDAEVKAFWSNT